MYAKGFQHWWELVVALTVHTPGTGKMPHSSIAHPGNRVKCYTCSSIMPRPPQSCLGPPLSGIGVSVLPGCSLSSFMERSFMDDWLHAPIPSQNIPLLKCIPLPWYPMMVIWAESFLLSGMNAHQFTGQSSSFKPGWTQHTDNINLLQMVRLLVTCQKSTSYSLYLSGKTSLSSQLVSWVLGCCPMPASWWFLM